MFEKSKIVAHFTNLTVAAGTSTSHRKVIAKMTTTTGLMDKAIQFTKDISEPQLGAAYLVITSSEMAPRVNAPPSLVSALSDLLLETVVTLNSYSGNRPDVAERLLNAAMDVQLKLLSSPAGPNPSP